MTGQDVGFVFDRGFAAPTIVQHLANQQIRFYLRIKAGKKVLGRKGGITVRRLTAGRHPIWAYGQRLNLVVTPQPEAGKEPWYLVTNCLEASAEYITSIYYHRFETSYSAVNALSQILRHRLARLTTPPV